MNTENLRTVNVKNVIARVSLPFSLPLFSLHARPLKCQWRGWRPCSESILSSGAHHRSHCKHSSNRRGAEGNRWTINYRGRLRHVPSSVMRTTQAIQWHEVHSCWTRIQAYAVQSSFTVPEHARARIRRSHPLTCQHYSCTLRPRWCASAAQSPRPPQRVVCACPTRAPAILISGIIMLHLCFKIFADTLCRQRKINLIVSSVSDSSRT